MCVNENSREGHTGTSVARGQQGQVLISVVGSDLDGYDLNVYGSVEDMENDNPLDGGMCDGSLYEAIDLAAELAKRLAVLVDDNREGVL